MGKQDSAQPEIDTVLVIKESVMNLRVIGHSLVYEGSDRM